MSTAAYLGRIDGEKRCRICADDPLEHDFDDNRLIALDLSKTPSAALAGAIAWADVEVDDCFSAPNGELAGTTLGPGWPELQIAAGAMLERRFVEKLPPHLRPSCPPRLMHGRAYEHTALLYWPGIDDPRAGNRYAGHHAILVEERGALARLRVFPPGTSTLDRGRPLSMWIDLSSPEQCDAGVNALTTIGVGDAPKEGAIYLISGRLQME